MFFETFSNAIRILMKNSNLMALFKIGDSTSAIIGNNIVYKNGVLTVDGKQVNLPKDQKLVNITVEGNVDSIVSEYSEITINGDVETVSNTSGDIKIIGDVEGDINAVSGDIDVKGHVSGDVQTVSGDISAKQIIGSAKSTSGDITSK